MNRREFIQRSALASAGAYLYACGASPAASKTMGIQLYTLRNIIGGDVKGTMQKVADIGFKELECYSYGNGQIFGMPYGDFNSMIKDMGMKITSGHYSLGLAHPEQPSTITNGWEAAVADAKNIGQEYMVLAYLDQTERETIDQYKQTCEMLNKANETCKSAGIKLAYHNHEFEFVEIDGQIPYDVMLQELDPSISMELDLYWITYAGKDPLAYFNQYPGRFHQWHVKDMDKANPKMQADVGSGAIDFKAIFAKAEQAGLVHFYLEQENYASSEFESVTNGYNYLKTI